jgi:hypothetical protein
LARTRVHTHAWHPSQQWLLATTRMPLSILRNCSIICWQSLQANRQIKARSEMQLKRQRSSTMQVTGRAGSINTGPSGRGGGLQVAVDVRSLY